MNEYLNEKQINAGVIIGASTFAGFSLIIPLMILTNPPSEWGFALLYLVYFVISGQILIGLALSFLTGFISYLIFRALFKKSVSKIIITFSSVIGLIIGFLAFFPAKTFLMEMDSGKVKIWEIDTNSDRIIDKWVHDDVYGKTLQVDYDTNLDGKPDVWEYYKNRELCKKEIDTDFDGKPDKTENYK